MFAPLLKKLFGSKNEREVKRMLKTVQAVNALEEQMIALSDEQLRGKTEELRGVWLRAKPSTSCFPKPLPWPVRPVSG